MSAVTDTEMTDNIITIPPLDNPSGHPPPCLSWQKEGYWACHFEAMASPCEILIDAPISQQLAVQYVTVAVVETWRIENKFSRYTAGNIINQINSSAGTPVPVDNETAQLLNYADTCFKLSGGKFDISSGLLRKVWRFDGKNQIPRQKQIDEILPLIGWDKCHWLDPIITLPKGAEIDFGGIGKEYAVDQCLQLVSGALIKDNVEPSAILINYGGDIACTGVRKNAEAWVIGIEDIGSESIPKQKKCLHLSEGGLATSGDSHRFVHFRGRRLGHILNPLTGWPVANAPATVTVHAKSCTLAGMLATFAILQGDKAESFLSAQNVTYWIQYH